MEKDVVYILREGENEELRYSLRTLTNLPHRKVVFVGGKPEGLEPDIWIPFNQIKDKWGNARDLIELMCKDNRLTKEVYLFNDDFFVMKPVKNVPVYTNGDLRQFARFVTRNGQRESEYITTRINPTIKELQSRGLPTVNYELHLPICISREKMLKIFRLFPRFVASRSTYGNYYRLRGERIGLNFHDGSVQSPKDKLNPERTFISTTDESWQGVVGKQIKELFPNPSRYEL